MVHCIRNNNHQNKRKENYLEIDVNEDLQKEMGLLSTEDTQKSSVDEHQATIQQAKKKEIEEKNLKSDAFSVLDYEQVKRLHNVIEQVVPIHGRGNFPTLDIKLKDLVKVVRNKLENEQSIKVADIRINGGAATWILLPENSTYNDLDLIFAVDLSDATTYEKIRTAVLDSLLDFLPETANRNRISLNSLKDAYIHKMVKVNEKDHKSGKDQWSLISLSNNSGRNVELKFVDKMKRQFEFSVDSFHIILDSLMLFYECSDRPISENIYPTVLAESVYGDFNEAFSHLEKKLIATRNPEQIRGGGLLKYCNLLIRNYKVEKPEEIKNLEKYMCSRFFIDFSELPAQRSKLESYLTNHFNGDDSTKTHYLMQLYKVVDESTVCLMSHERRSTLALIEEMAYRFYIRSQQQTTTNQTQTTQQYASHHYQLHFPHYSNTTTNNQQPNQTATPQFFPHVHHHLIRSHPHHPFELMIAAQQQQTTNNQKNANNQNLVANNSNSATVTNKISAGTNSSINSTASKNSLTNSSLNQSNVQSTHSNSTSNKNSIKNQQQHIQQYHAYLFGTTGQANTFYYNPYHHHHHNYHPHSGCFNSMSCQCGVWMACAWDEFPNFVIVSNSYFIQNKNFIINSQIDLNRQEEQFKLMQRTYDENLMRNQFRSFFLEEQKILTNKRKLLFNQRNPLGKKDGSLQRIK